MCVLCINFLIGSLVFLAACKKKRGEERGEEMKKNFSISHDDDDDCKVGE